MNKINCEVTNCSHNNSGVCFSNRVDIGGLNASSESGTCCGSFLNKSLYSDLTSNTNSQGKCDCLICKVDTCTHNCNNLCNLDSINVCGFNSQIYTETLCGSFERK